MKTLIKNALIIPMTENGLFYKGDIKIENNIISDNPDFVADQIIDASNMICMPALINSHTHTSMGLMRNYKDTAPNLMAWLSEIFPIEDKLVTNDIKWATTLAMAEMIQSGITCFSDMYFMQEITCEALIKSKMRAKVGLTIFGNLEESKEKAKNYKDIYNKYNNASNGRINFSVAPHAIYTTNSDSYLFANKWIQENPSILHTHMSETQGEVDNCLKEHGTTPLMYLEQKGALDNIKAVLAHGVYLSDEEVKLCRERNFSIVHNPSSNCKLASGIAPIAHYIKEGVNVCLGTDGSSSNNDQDMFEEMHLAAMLSSVSNMDPMATTPYQILEMATINGAKALGIDDKVGSLEVGKEADIILIDINKSHLTPLNDPFSALIYSTKSTDVDTVFCQGELLMKNRELKTIDIDCVIKNTNICWDQLLKR